jgi:hypothetical protein
VYLSKQQENFCENTGLVGVLISSICLIQHMVFMIPDWITFTIIGVYILCIAGFILLMKKMWLSPLILAISCSLIFILEIFMILSLAFSLVLVLLLIYLLIITVLLYVDGIASQLKKKNIAVKEEAATWSDIL